MTILLVNEVSYQSTLFILFCKILACFWLMSLVQSTYLWVSPAIFFKPYPHKWDSWILTFLPQSLCPLCGKFYSLFFTSFFLSVCLSLCLSLLSYLLAFFSFVEYQTWGSLHTRQMLHHWAAPQPLCLFLCLWASGWLLPCVRLCASVSSCSGPDRAALGWEHSFPQNACINCDWAVCSGPGACWDSCLSSLLVFYSHIPGAVHMAYHSSEWPRGKLPVCLGHRSLLVTLRLVWWPCGFRWVL